MPSALQPLLPVPELHAAIKNHYDGLISLYEDLWGEHIHHGYWDTPGDRNRHDAQLHLVEKLIEFEEDSDGRRLLKAMLGSASKPRMDRSETETKETDQHIVSTVPGDRS